LKRRNRYYQTKAIVANFGRYGVKAVLMKKKECILEQYPTEVRPSRAVEFTLLMVKKTSYAGFPFLVKHASLNFPAAD